MGLGHSQFPLPVTRYCESSEKAQFQIQRWVGSFNVVFREKSAVCQILTVVSADVVANKLEKRQSRNCIKKSWPTIKNSADVQYII